MVGRGWYTVSNGGNKWQSFWLLFTAVKWRPPLPSKMVTSTGIETGAVGEAIAGYSILTAADVDAAAKMAAKAPGIDQGMKAAVYPLADMDGATG